MAVKAREVRAKLQGKVAPELLQVLEALADDNSHRLQMLYELARITDAILDDLNILQAALRQIGYTTDLISKKHPDVVKAMKEKYDAEVESRIIGERKQ